MSSLLFSSESLFYSFTINDLSGNPIHFDAFKEHPVLVVNVASKCGFTPQYAELQTLYDTYKEEGLIIIGVPSNDFFQERGSDSEIAQFCSLNYGVTFPITTKLHVKKNPKHPLYDFLTKTDTVSWNFNKYLVDKKGTVIAHFGSRVSPTSVEIKSAIQNALTH